MLFNFYEASSLDVKGVIGSVLAPYATVSENWGQVNGNVIVDTWASTVQINANHYFTPVDVAAFTMGGKNADTIPPGDVPEPGSVALLLAGLAAAALVRRRGRRQA